MGRSNRLSYEATDVGIRSFVGSNFPARNESMNEMIYETNHILSCDDLDFISAVPYMIHFIFHFVHINRRLDKIGYCQR